jgi:hypothetical protein
MAGFLKVIPAVSAAATAATAATTALLRKVVSRRNTAKLDGRSNILADFLLQHLKLTLGGKEVPGDFIFKQRIPGVLEITDLGGSQHYACMLLVMQFLATLVDTLVLKARPIITQKSLHLLLEIQKGWITCNLGAELLGFFNHRGFFGYNGHAASITLNIRPCNGNCGNFISPFPHFP